MERVKVSYPRFKNGEATVRDVRITPNFGKSQVYLTQAQVHADSFCNSTLFGIFTDYVEEIFDTFMKATKDNLKDAATKLQEKTPSPTNTMLEKQLRAEALQKRAERSKIVSKDAPPTTPGI